MRATTTTMPMTRAELSRTIPTPRFKVGDKVKWPRSGNREYYQRRYLRHLIKHWRMRSRGRLSGHVKQLIRDAYNVIHQATEVEVAGIVTSGMHGVDYAGYNECYIGGVPGASSPLRFQYQLLVRWVKDNNRLAMTTGIAVAGEADIEIVKA